MGTMTLTSGIGIFVVPVIADKFGRVKANTSAMISLCILYTAMAFISGRIYLLLVIVTAMMQCMMAGFVDSPILSSVADEEKGSFSGFRLVFINIGTSVGTYIAGYMIGMEQGITVLYLTACFLMGLQLVLFVFGFKRAIPE
jgi:predicted MFS family arabinose efflux permease